MTNSEPKDEQPYTHFVTFSCYKRRRLLDNDPVRRIVLGVLDSQFSNDEARRAACRLCSDA